MLGGGVAALAVFGKLDREACAHHRLAEIAAVGGAERDLAVVAVALESGAGDHAARGCRGERARSHAAAPIGPPGAVSADLAAFRRIDAEQTDLLAGERSGRRSGQPGSLADLPATILFGLGAPTTSDVANGTWAQGPSGSGVPQPTPSGATEGRALVRGYVTR